MAEPPAKALPVNWENPGLDCRERHIAGRGLNPHHDAVVEHMFVTQVGLAADPALDPLASPDRDARPDRKSRPIIRRDVGCAGAERRISRRSGRQISGGGRPGLEASRSRTDRRGGKTNANDAHDAHLYHNSPREALRFRVRHIDGALRSAHRLSGLKPWSVTPWSGVRPSGLVAGAGSIPVNKNIVAHNSEFWNPYQQ